MYRIIGADQKEYGPVSADQLHQWIAQSRVNPQTQAKPEGATDWQTLGTLPEFAAAFAAPQTAATPRPAGGYVDSAKTSGLAIASLTLGICGLISCGITSIVGLILGIVAMVKIKNSEGQLKGNGLAIAGICVSGLFLLMIPIQAAMLLPALAKAKGRAQRINCVNNAKQISIGIRSYAIDHNDQLPPAATWCDAIQNDVGSPMVFRCPTASGSRCGYAYNRNLDGKKISEVDPQTVMLFESDAGWNGAGGAELVAMSHHDRSVNVVFADGSVQTVTQSRLATLRWDP